MDKVIRRTSQAVRQAQRKARARAELAAQVERSTYFRHMHQRERVFADAARESRAAMLEDWAKGALAPRRDAGDKHGVYGAAHQVVASLPKVPVPDRRKFINIAVGDHVCIIRGKDKGKVDKVMTLDRESESVTLWDSNKYEIEAPEAAIDDQDPFATQLFPAPVPLDDVRLVYPIYDPTTGRTRDTLIPALRGGGPFLQRACDSGIPRHTRYIAGTDTVLAWPAAGKPKHAERPADTPRILAESHSFMPVLSEFPFPASVLDELRNRYSVFRTRHEPSYLANKVEESMRKEWAAGRTLVTPRTEAMARAVEERKARREKKKVGRPGEKQGEVVLPQGSVQFIREVMEARQKEGEI